MYDIFDAPITPGDFARQTEAVMQLFPINANLAAFVKTVYSSLQGAMDVGQTVQGFNALYNRDYDRRRGIER